MEDDLDDLFGDVGDVGDGHSLQLSEPLPKGLLQRVDEIALSGCCQKLVWSRNGCIAYITRDGCNVVVRNLMCDSSNGQWRMSKEYPVDGVVTAHSGHQLVHLSWSHHGNELAIIDAFGQISIYSVFIAINRLSLYRRCVPDPEDHLSAVIGMTWLHLDRISYFPKAMLQAKNQWSFTVSQQRLLGPRNPYQHINNPQKAAMVAVTRSGMIRVLYQGQDNRWQDFKCESENIASPFELLTHATMCPEKIADVKSPEKESPLLLATYNSDKELRVYRLSLDFEHQRIGLQHLKVLNHCTPLDESPDGASARSDGVQSRSQLSLLEFLPPSPRSGNKEPTHPILLASFSYASDHFQHSPAHAAQATVLCKWELQIVTPKLHTSFNSLSSKKGSASPVTELPPEILMKRSSDILLPRALLSIQQMIVRPVLAMVYCEGVVEYREITNMNVIPRDGKDQISSMAQIGLYIPGSRFCLHTAISPNACAAVSLDEQYLASLSSMQLEDVHTSDEFDEARLEVILEAFVMQSTVASLNIINNEDIVAALQAFLNQYLHGQAHAAHTTTLFNPDTFKSHFMSELYRTIGVRVDYSIEPQMQQLLMSNQGLILQRCLSFQAALGYAEGSHRPSLSANLAWAILNIRSICLVFFGAISRKQGVESELGKPDTIHVLVGLVSWLMTLIGYIVDELFVLGDFFEDHTDEAGNISLDDLNARIHEANSPALFLLFVSSSRNFLKFSCNPLKVFIHNCKNQQSQTPLRLAYQELGAVFQKSLVSVPQFERLLSQLDDSIKSVYQSSGISETERSNVEKNMLVKAEIPEILFETVKELLTKTAASLKEEVEVADLYFANVASLGLTNDNTGKRWRKEHPLDAMRKIELKGVQTRRCTRCGAVMEDLLPTRTANVMVTQLKHCFCGSWWMVGGEEEGKGSGY